MTTPREGNMSSVDFDDDETVVDGRNLITGQVEQPTTKSRKSGAIFALAIIFVVLLCLVIGAAGHKVYYDRYYTYETNQTSAEDYEKFYKMVHDHFSNCSGAR